MSILAEPRKRKQRISVDPQNMTWKKDKGKIGQKLLEKMGWQEGKGLGAQEHGRTENVRLNANHTAKGLGFEGKNHDTVWMAQHDEFESLLANLNKSKKSSSTQKSNESEIPKEVKTKSRIQIRYNKFTRGKDLSCYSNKEKCAILGIPQTKPKKGSEEETESTSEIEPVMEPLPSNGNTTVSSMSVQDYFAAKMAALIKRQQPSLDITEDLKESKGEDPERKIKKKKSKRKKFEESNEDLS